MFWHLALLAVAAPTAAQVQIIELDRVSAPLTSYAKDGRAYVEFAPDVETRNVACTLEKQSIFKCNYEARTRPAFEREFGPWERRQARLVWRRNCWIRLGGVNPSP